MQGFLKSTCKRIALAGVCLSFTIASSAIAQVSHPKSQTTYPGGRWEPGPAKFGSAISSNVPVTMDDGTVLRATIAYPTDLATKQRASGKFPVIIEHTPYGFNGQPVPPNTYLTQHGYIYVVLRTRGTGASQGEVDFFGERDSKDGKAAVDWAAHQLEGADGRVALMGCSYPGGLALDTAAYVGPNSPVKAVVASCVGLSQVNRESLLNAGLMTAGFWNYTSATHAMWGPNPAADKFVEWFSAEVRDGGDAAYDRAFWHDRNSITLAQKLYDSGIPVLLWSGWRDIVEFGAVRAYSALQNAYAGAPIYGPMAQDQKTTSRYQIVLGDWEHSQALDSGIFLEWLDTWVKGVDTGIQKTSTPMHLFEPGTDRWINLKGFPGVSDYTSWYLDSGASLSASTPKSDGKDSLNWGTPAMFGPRLTFSTPPLEKGATLAGPISATIFASSNNTNLELLAELYDVGPDERQTLITKGAIVGSLRELDQEKTWIDRRGTSVWPWPKLDQDEYLKPGEVYRLDIGLLPRLWAVNPGHLLRLVLTTQSTAETCPATGTPPRNEPAPCRLTKPQQATLPGGKYAIMHGPKWPSSLNVPQLPWKAFPAVRSGLTGTVEAMQWPGLGLQNLTKPLDWGSESSVKPHK